MMLKELMANVLTLRERIVLELIADGHTVSELAALYKVSRGRIVTIRDTARRKMKWHLRLRELRVA